MAIKVATPKDFQRISQFAKAQSLASGQSEAEIMMASWDLPWREESLEFYLKGGWCFVSEEENTGDLHGYLLAQPLLFFRHYTQSLWVEWVSANSQERVEELLDVAYRWARSKHLQKVVMAQNLVEEEKLGALFPGLAHRHFFEVSSTKLTEESP